MGGQIRKKLGQIRNSLIISIGKIAFLTFLAHFI
jgi:hypothetical protein